MSNKQKTEWECLTCGKKWWTNYSTIQQGSGCPRCAGKERRGPDDFTKLGEEKGYPWLGPPVATVDAKTEWYCGRCKGPFRGSYTYIRQGHGCQKCNARQLKPAQFRAVAQRLQLEWLEKGVPSSGSRERWRCKRCRRTFTADIYGVQKSRGCRLCSKDFEDLPTPPSAYEKLAQNAGFTWLGPRVRNTTTNTRWRGKRCGHEFSKNYELMSRQPSCPQCSKIRPKDEADYRALAKRKHLKCLRPKVANSNTRTSWKCERGHVFHASYQDVVKRKGCPTCNQRWRITPPEQYHALAEKLKLVVWLGPPVSHQGSATWWQCTSASPPHRYKSSFNGVRKRKGRCPECRQSSKDAKSRNSPNATEHLERKPEKEVRGHPVHREIDHSSQELEFMQSMSAFIRRTGIRHPTWTQVFDVLLSCGYTRQPEPDQTEFEEAMRTYIQSGGRKFPTWSQVLSVFQQLGYEKATGDTNGQDGK
jgi:transposase-like protein